MSEENANIRALKLLYSFCPAYFPLMLLRTFLDKLIPYFNLYLSAEIINSISRGINLNKIITLVLITVIGNFILAVSVGILSGICRCKRVRLDLREAAYGNRKTLTLNYPDLESTEIRQLKRKITESSKIDNYGKGSLLSNTESMANHVINMVIAIILFVELFVTVFQVSKLITVLFCAFVAALVVVNVLYIFSVYNRNLKLSDNLSQILIDENRIDEAVDCYNMGKDVRMYRQHTIIMDIKKRAFNMEQDAHRKYANVQFTSNIPLLMISMFLNIGVYTFICIYTVKGILGIGSLIKYVGITKTLIDCIIAIFSTIASLKSNTSFVEDYLRYYDISEKMNTGTLKVNKLSLLQNAGNIIEFRDVSFKYPGAENYALWQVNFVLRMDEQLAIVGRNGSGKTTLVKLLCRLYDPTEGEILLNGINIMEYDYNEYISLFSVVFQDFKLFSFTLGQNVAAGSDYDAESVKSCLCNAGFETRFSTMPNGLDTYLYKDFTSDGIEVSGGEAQKISIARALYKDSPFILLDEPTAAIDPIAEAELFDRFNKMIVSGKTAVYISHRMASCIFCDRIVVCDHGQIVQQGSHKDLIADKDGKYFELWNAQAQHYIG